MDKLPLAQRSTPRIHESNWVEVLPPAQRFVLRGAAQVMAAAGGALGLDISQAACRAAVSERRAALWLGPDEQLILADEHDEAVATALQSALRELPHSLVDVSHRQRALRVSGAAATALLSVGCPLDLDLSAFPVGMCTRTVCAKAEIVLWRTGPAAFHLEVWRSFAAYVSGFLAEAARELVISGEQS